MMRAVVAKHVAYLRDFMPPLRLLTTILLVAHLPQSEQWCFGNRSRDVAYCGDGRPRGHRGCRVDDASAEELFTIRITLPSITLAELLGFLIFVELCIISSKVGTANPLLAEIAARSKNQSLLHSDNSSLSAPASPSAERYRDRSRSRADSMPPVDRVLSTNAATFSAALLGDDDVDVEVFMRGCREFATTVLTKLGSFTTPAYKQVHDNMAKVDTTYLLNPERFRSMHAILEEEVHSQMHSRMATSGLADPSAAMGLLWARRGLRYWLVLFRPLLDGTGGLPGYDEAMAA